MLVNITTAATELAAIGVNEATVLAKQIERCMTESNGELRWERLVADVLCGPPARRRLPFAVHQYCFAKAYADRDPGEAPAPAWLPSMEQAGKTNVSALCRTVAAKDALSLYHWSIEQRPAFWQLMIERLGICFDGEPGPAWHNGKWFPDARLNIATTCLQSSGKNEPPAIVYRSSEGLALTAVSRTELEGLARAVAGYCLRSGLRPGAYVALYLPMTVEAVAAYLGVILAGCTAVSIADSFSSRQVAIRLAITKSSLAIVGTRTYKRLVEADPGLKTIVVGDLPDAFRQRAIDKTWDQIIGEPGEPVICPSAAHTNILFSSGTTGNPKAIPWDHLTPIKCAVDAHLLQDVQPGETIAWPTSLGWMMGPWLVYAALINKATIALYYPGPDSAGFGQFVQDAGVNMLGIVPTLARKWRSSRCMENFDWRCIRRFSSTGECSDPTDQLYLMSLAGYQPVIEYCGGTEIGGGYISGTMEHPAAPATFTTPAFGIGISIHDANGNPADNGELHLVPPSIGLSTQLLNQDHDEAYFTGTPLLDGQPLRRHGDYLQELSGGYYRALGRTDDTMNLSGIKVSAIEIERELSTIDGLKECAAVSIQNDSIGPNKLVVFVVLTRPIKDLRHALQQVLNQRLNPLFRIAEVQQIKELPRTASNKILRRELRTSYAQTDKPTLGIDKVL